MKIELYNWGVKQAEQTWNRSIEEAIGYYTRFILQGGAINRVHIHEAGGTAYSIFRISDTMARITEWDGCECH